MAKVIERLEQKQCELAQPREKAYLLKAPFILLFHNFTTF